MNLRRRLKSKTHPNLFDFKTAKVLMIRAIKKYLAANSKGKAGDRYGYFHGAAGINRANNALECLKHISDTNKPAFLAWLLAVFGKPSVGFFASIGRSSALASMIADAFIAGRYAYGVLRFPTDTTTSKVFSKTSLARVKLTDDAMRHNSYDMTTESYFDRTKGVRFLLQDILNSSEFLNYKPAIELLATKLASSLPSSSLQIDMKIFNDLNDQFNAYNKSISAASFDSAALRLPPEIGEQIGTFFSLKDAGAMARLNKATSKAARVYTPTKP